MIRPALLLGISGFGWYLACSRTAHPVCPGIWTGLALLVFLSLLPIVLGYYTNLRLLDSGPTIIKFLLLNLLALSLYTSSIFTGILLFSPFYAQTITESIYAAWLVLFWHLVSWTCGVVFAYCTGLPSPEKRQAEMRAVEISLILVIPVIFLLTSMGFQSLFLLLFIALWFLALACNLALKGYEDNEEASLRWDIIFFHAIIPVLATILIFFAAFTGEAYALLQNAKNVLLAAIKLLVLLLDRLLAGYIPPDYQLPASSFGFQKPESGPIGQNPGFLVQIAAVIILLVLSVLFLRSLLPLLKTRLFVKSAKKNFIFSPVRFLRQLWQVLHLFLAFFLKIPVYVGFWIMGLCRKLVRRASSLIRRLLPPLTPLASIHRSYEGFLRWGQRLGVRRKPAETPLDYLQRLKESSVKLSSRLEEAGRLTELFLNARYSSQPANWEQASECSRLLSRIKTG